MRDMFDPFSHFLAFGMSDQQTLRTLTNQYDGMIVPGTIAAYQADPTRGFVLSLSAAEELPYAIDSRFPLFQTFLGDPKPSHVLLARILGLEFGEDGYWLRGSALSPESIRLMAERWIDFNTSYAGQPSKQFDKYARRLNRPMPQQRASGPRWILPPYLMKDELFPNALDVSRQFWDASVIAAEEKGAVHLLRRVIAVKEPAELGEAALASGQDEVVVWVSNLDELKPENRGRLRDYARSLANMSASNVRPFALYGGYFSVMLRSFGLAGASHGVGFSESRDHVELKSSGAAPARFYVSRLHRFIPRDLASELWRRRPELVDSEYSGYESRDPADLDYHDLMAHSVMARKHEILLSRGLTSSDYVRQCESELLAFRADLARIKLTSALSKRISDLTNHLDVWADALRTA